MGTFHAASSATYQYYNFGGFIDWFRVGAASDTDLNISEIGVDGSIDDLLVPGEDVQVTPGGATFDYLGTYSFTGSGGTYEFIVLRDLFTTGTNGQYYLYSTSELADVEYPFGFAPGSIVSDNTVLCFAAGTLIATPHGEQRVETLREGDPILTAKGHVTPVKWLGRMTASKLRVGMRIEPVRIAKGALGHGLPHSDLTVTGDHAMMIDGLMINAAALVNGTTINWVPMADLPERMTYYHVETAAHDVILANGAPTESFVDVISRTHFDNHADYLARYGAEQLIPEMPLPRITSSRLVPEAIRRRLGGRSHSTTNSRRIIA